MNDVTMLVVASVIGSGIFFTPGRVADLVPHAGVILLAWLLGGALSLAGAFANAELGAMYPRAGGDYVYLREAFHPCAGFLVGWLTFFAIFSGTVATLAVALAGGLTAFVPLGEGRTVIVAIAFIAATSAINYVGLRWGARVNNLTSYLKIAALLAFCIAGPLLGRGAVAHAETGAVRLPAISLAAFGLALSPILFTYLGWNAPIYVASEIRNPARNLPRSLFLGLAICVGIYLLINAVYLYALPLEDLRGAVNVGEAAARALFGPLAGSLVALFVLVSILGTLNATILVGPRIAYAMAIDGLFFAGADRTHADYRTPHRAIVVQGLVAIALVAVLQTFPSVLDFTVFAIVLAAIADTLALFALRARRPHLPRPYRAWGYPLVPALYLVANAGIALVMLDQRPLECAIGLLSLALGLPFYWLFVRRPASADEA
ncbi:MAG: amino acid permease [Deltaproteobacteria bacterium]|nr:MAG: amino acid permease [Deltaproteobacteria bacterium]